MIDEKELKLSAKAMGSVNEHDHFWDSILMPGVSLNSFTINRISLTIDYVKAIYVDEQARLIVVKFQDNQIEKIKCSKEDDFDISIGVSLAIARHVFGSHARFYKHILGKKVIYTKRLEPTEYEIYNKWCKEHKERLVSETTFKKNKAKYLNRMKGE